MELFGVDGLYGTPRSRVVDLTYKSKGRFKIHCPMAQVVSVLVVSIVLQAGFRYHHAEADYVMLVYWIPDTPDTIPPNASHRIGVGAFVINNNREVLVVQENSGKFGGTGVWKMPTGAVNEGEDIYDAVIREVKEETGIETKFVEILAFRESHKSFFQKTDLFFVCMLQPQSFDIHKQDSEIKDVIAWCCGSTSAEVIADVALCPFEAVKVRIQTQPSFARGLSDGLPKFVKSEGTLGYAYKY